MPVCLGHCCFDLFKLFLAFFNADKRDVEEEADGVETIITSGTQKRRGDSFGKIKFSTRFELDKLSKGKNSHK